MGERNQQWRNRITGYGSEAPDQLVANPRNWRIHPRQQQDALAGVLSEVGIVQNVIVNQRTGYVVDGHLRVSLALRDNIPTIPVTYVDLSEDEEALILATLDPLGAQAATDARQLEELLRDVSAADERVMQLLSEIAQNEGIVPREDFDPNAEWVGMPEFSQEDQMPIKQVIVSFQSVADVERFARLVEQDVTMTTKGIWYPRVDRIRRVDHGYVEESDAA